MLERCYYKVERSEEGLFERANEFLALEDSLRKTQQNAIVDKLPKFSEYAGLSGFNRVVRFTGFFFEDRNSVDPKVWKTKEVDGKMLSTPNRSTKAGREMYEFLNSFKRTTQIDVDHLLRIDSVYHANLFKYNDCIYIYIDSRCRSDFERNNPDAIEISYDEMIKAVDSYNSRV